jgi:hypothetical protein
MGATRWAPGQVSNPYVMSIDQTGYAKALRPGTSNIHFSTLSGQTISEWTMTVEDSCPAGCSGLSY